MSMSKRSSISSYSRKCLVPQSYVLPFDLFNRAELLLPYKSYVKKQCKERFLKQLNIRADERHKNCFKEFLMELNKLEDDLDPVCTVMEYDDEFFNIVNGRPLFHCIPLYKSLTGILDRRFRIVQEISYKKDSALNIDMNFRLEKNIHDDTLQRCFEEAKAFDKFIMEDYHNSMTILDEEEKLNLKLDAKMSELQSLAEESFTIKSRLLGLDYKYGLQQKYGRFLYYLSPPTWRSNNREFARSVEIEAKGFDFGNSHDEDTFTAMFDKMRRECTFPVKPVLYFTHPHDLLSVFSGMEQQLLYHFSRDTALSPHNKTVHDVIRMLKHEIDRDTAIVTTSIKGFKNLLSMCEERSVQLKDQFLKVLHGFFYEAVGTADVLKFVFHLEFCYSKVFHEKPINLDMLTVARAIESMYMDYSKRLDAIQSGTVRRVMNRCMDLNNQKMNKAKKAAKELRSFYRLERELLRAHNLLSQEDLLKNEQSNYLAKKKFKRDVSRCRVTKRSYQSLNEAEIDYLTLFTDWNKNEDPALYLQSLNFDKDKKTGDF